MEQTKFDEYVNGRYTGKITWYDIRAVRNKRFYLVLQSAVIALSASIPVLVVSLGESYKWLNAGLGVLLAIGTAGLKTFKFQENWINYRSTAETLKREK